MVSSVARLALKEQSSIDSAVHASSISLVKQAAWIALDEERAAHKRTKLALEKERKEHEATRSLIYGAELAIRHERSHHLFSAQETYAALHAEERYAALCAAFVNEQVDSQNLHLKEIARVEDKMSAEISQLKQDHQQRMSGQARMFA